MKTGVGLEVLFPGVGMVLASGVGGGPEGGIIAGSGVVVGGVLGADESLAGGRLDGKIIAGLGAVGGGVSGGTSLGLGVVDAGLWVVVEGGITAGLGVVAIGGGLGDSVI